MKSGPISRLVMFGAALIVGCYSPTLPLPPPVKPEITMTETGTYHVAGGVLPDAQVSALNERTLLIDGQQSDHAGFYAFDLHEGRPHDVIELWYRYSNDLSSAVVFELPAPSELGGAGGAGGAPSGEGGASGTTP